MEKTLSLVIPCLNEEEAVLPVLEAVTDVRNYFLNELEFHEVQVIVVDDASRDQSANLIRRFPFVELHQHSETKGYGTSLRRGFENSRGKWICFFDMDNSYPPQQLIPMWKMLVREELDMVSGQRAFSGEGMSFTRGFGNWMFSALTKVFFKNAIQDVCSGFRLFDRNCLADILTISESSLGYSLEMSIRLSSLGWKTKEYKINYMPRKGASKLSVWKDGWTFLFLILSAAVRYRMKKEVRL